jgi:hypothetical protein
MAKRSRSILTSATQVLNAHLSVYTPMHHFSVSWSSPEAGHGCMHPLVRKSRLHRFATEERQEKRQNEPHRVDHKVSPRFSAFASVCNSFSTILLINPVCRLPEL